MRNLRRFFNCRMEAGDSISMDIKPYFKNSLVTLYHGDCLELLSRLGMVFDAVIADPPYGVTPYAWDEVIPFGRMWEVLRQSARRSAAVCLFGSEPFSSLVRTGNLGMYKYDWYWEKSRNSNYMLARVQPLRHIEQIMVFCDGNPPYHPIMEAGEDYTTRHRDRCGIMGGNTRTKDIGGRVRNTRFPKNILRIPSIYPNETLHPTQKPVALIEYLVRTYTVEGEAVLDFCAGSGTTGIACMNTDRRCVLVEKEERYCEIAARRLERHKVQMAFF